MVQVSKFGYITDTHWHATPETCWSQQPACPDLLPRLWNDLTRFLEKNPVEFMLHGGDLTHEGSEFQIRQAAEMCQKLPIPTKLALGNHDLAQPISMNCWREFRTTFFDHFLTESCDFAVDLDFANLLVMQNAWVGNDSKPDFYWTPDCPLHAGFTDAQFDWLDDQLNRRPRRPIILAMHETLCPLPPRLTGLDDPIHAPQGDDVRKIQKFIGNHPQIRLVLSGHCHASCRTVRNGTTFLTTAAFVEPPFQIRLIEVTPSSIDVSVAYPVDLAHYDIHIDEQKRWSAGQWNDWRVNIRL